MRISWSARARRDIRNLRVYIAKDSPYYARRFVDQLVTSVDRLSEHPYSGRTVPEIEREDVREILFQHYRIIYLIGSDVIHILTVLHGRRDFASSNVLEPEGS